LGREEIRRVIPIQSTVLHRKGGASFAFRHCQSGRGRKGCSILDLPPAGAEIREGTTFRSLRSQEGRLPTVRKKRREHVLQDKRTYGRTRGLRVKFRTRDVRLSPRVRYIHVCQRRRRNNSAAKARHRQRTHGGQGAPLRSRRRAAPTKKLGARGHSPARWRKSASVRPG
jgi:hypothetical protein